MPCVRFGPAPGYVTGAGPRGLVTLPVRRTPAEMRVVRLIPWRREDEVTDHVFKSMILAIILSSGKSSINVPSRDANRPSTRYWYSCGLICAATAFGYAPAEDPLAKLMYHASLLSPFASSSSAWIASYFALMLAGRIVGTAYWS